MTVAVRPASQSRPACRRRGRRAWARRGDAWPRPYCPAPRAALRCGMAAVSQWCEQRSCMLVAVCQPTLVFKMYLIRPAQPSSKGSLVLWHGSAELLLAAEDAAFPGAAQLLRGSGRICKGFRPSHAHLLGCTAHCCRAGSKISGSTHAPVPCCIWLPILAICPIRGAGLSAARHNIICSQRLCSSSMGGLLLQSWWHALRPGA